MCDIVVKKFTFAISSPDEFLSVYVDGLLAGWQMQMLVVFGKSCIMSLSCVVDTSLNRYKNSIDESSDISIIGYHEQQLQINIEIYYCWALRQAEDKRTVF